MTDDVERERAEPEAIGPPRRRSRVERIKAERGRRRRRFARRFALIVLVVVVVTAAVVGVKLWHTFRSGDDYTGSGKQDIMIQIQGRVIHHHDRGDDVQQRRGRHGPGIRPGRSRGNGRDYGDPAGFYRMRTEIPAAAAVRAADRSETRVGKLVIRKDANSTTPPT